MKSKWVFLGKLSGTAESGSKKKKNRLGKQGQLWEWENIPGRLQRSKLMLT